VPISDAYNAPWVISLLKNIKPTRILELGIGIGTYGLLIRNHLEISLERVRPPTWQLTIDGVEVFEAYANPIWDYFYNTVSVTDIKQFVASMGDYDVVLLIDVIEHFTKEEGLRLLDSTLRHSRYVIVTSPISDYPQGAICGNVHECHISSWGPSDLRNFFFKHKKLRTSFLAVLSSDREALDRLGFETLPDLKFPRRRRGLRSRMQRCIHGVIHCWGTRAATREA